MKARDATRGIPRTVSREERALDRAIARMRAQVLSGDLSLADALEAARLLDIAAQRDRAQREVSPQMLAAFERAARAADARDARVA